MLEFKTENQLKSYTRHSKDRLEQGETAHVENTNKIYIFNKEWTEIKTQGESNINMTVYEINEQLIKQLPDLTDEQIQKKKEEIRDFYLKKETKVYMLLCKEHSYFTVFLLEKDNQYNTMEEEVIACVLYGDNHKIRSIDNIDDNEIEIWAIDEDNAAWCYHLFDYQEGLIYCKE